MVGAIALTIDPMNEKLIIKCKQIILKVRFKSRIGLLKSKKNKKLISFMLVDGMVFHF